MGFDCGKKGRKLIACIRVNMHTLDDFRTKFAWLECHIDRHKPVFHGMAQKRAEAPNNILHRFGGLAFPQSGNGEVFDLISAYVA